MATIKISGMSCENCAKSVVNALNGIDGISGAQVDLDKKEASYCENVPVNMDIIKAAIAKIGFEIT